MDNTPVKLLRDLQTPIKDKSLSLRITDQRDTTVKPFGHISAQTQSQTRQKRIGFI